MLYLIFFSKTIKRVKSVNYSFGFSVTSSNRLTIEQGELFFSNVVATITSNEQQITAKLPAAYVGVFNASVILAQQVYEEGWKAKTE